MASISPDEEEELWLRLKVLLIPPGDRCGIGGWQRRLHLGAALGNSRQERPRGDVPIRREFRVVA